MLQLFHVVLYNPRILVLFTQPDAFGGMFRNLVLIPSDEPISILPVLHHSMFFIPSLLIVSVYLFFDGPTRLLYICYDGVGQLYCSYYRHLPLWMKPAMHVTQISFQLKTNKKNQNYTQFYIWNNNRTHLPQSACASIQPVGWELKGIPKKAKVSEGRGSCWHFVYNPTSNSLLVSSFSSSILLIFPPTNLL